MKKNIALMTGGDSGEFEISMKSAEQMKAILDSSLYNIYTIVVRGKDWIYDGSVNIDKNDFSLTIDGQKILFDCVFMALHGTPAEDGKLQGYFDIMGIPYTGCGVAASAITLNKWLTLKLVSGLGIKTCKSMILYKNKPYSIYNIFDKMTYPLFVKTNNGGSSVGMSKVKGLLDLQEAIDRAFQEDDEIIVEEYFEGREFTCAAYRTNGQLRVMPVVEIISHSKSGWFDFDAKYNGQSEEICPAKLKYATAEECQEYTLTICRAINIKGVVRCDFIWDGKEFRCLEVNTIPGMTAESIVPKMVKAMGMTLEQFYNNMITDAIR